MKSHQNYGWGNKVDKTGICVHYILGNSSNREQKGEDLLFLSKIRMTSIFFPDIYYGIFCPLFISCFFNDLGT